MSEQHTHTPTISQAEAAAESRVWYAMRVSYRQEIKVKQDLDARGIESFIPMKYTLVVRRARRVKVLVPIIAKNGAYWVSENGDTGSLFCFRWQS